MGVTTRFLLPTTSCGEKLLWPWLFVLSWPRLRAGIITESMRCGEEVRLQSEVPLKMLHVNNSVTFKRGWIMAGSARSDISD